MIKELDLPLSRSCILQSHISERTPYAVLGNLNVCPQRYA